MNAQSYVDHYNLAQFVGSYAESHRKAIASAPDKVSRAAKQDAARDFTRFVANSRIIPILKAAHDPTCALKFDPFALESRLVDLERDCVPGAAVNGVACGLPDGTAARLSAMENNLQLIAGHVSRLNADGNHKKKKPAPDRFTRHAASLAADARFRHSL